MVLGPFSLPDSIEVTSRFSWPASITIYNVLLPYSLPATVDTTPIPSEFRVFDGSAWQPAQFVVV